MDASKAKKEAPEAKIEESFFYISGFHLYIPLTSQVSIAKFNFACQYLFLRSFKGTGFQHVGRSAGIKTNGLIAADFLPGVTISAWSRQAGAKKELDTQNSIRYFCCNDSAK